jgi:hypothetical protein
MSGKLIALVPIGENISCEQQPPEQEETILCKDDSFSINLIKSQREVRALVSSRLFLEKI